MLEFLNAPEDVIAVRIGGRLTDAELTQIVERVETSIEAREKTHIYMEVEDLSGLDLGALARHLPRGAAMLGKLGRFGRIAVVSDQRWIRAWTRLESALRPGISYELFMPDEKAQALAWVEGRRELPHAPSIKIIETDRPDVFGFELDGSVSAAEMEAVADYFDEAFDRGEPVRLLGRIRRIGGFEPAGLFSGKYLQMKLKALRRVERYALVGGPAWLRAWAEALDPLVAAELRHFEAEEEALAWAWLGAQPKSERALAA